MEIKNHFWANPTANEVELSKYDSIPNVCYEKVKLGLKIIANNHNTEMSINTLYIDEGQIVFAFKCSNPIYADLSFLSEELGGKDVLEIDYHYTFVYATYYIQSEEEYKRLNDIFSY